MKIKATRTSLITINQKRLRHWLPITLILFLAATLYFYQLGTESLWIDEIFSIQAAQKNIFSLTLNRPLYFVLLHFWMRFGSSEAWLRGLSVIFGLGSVFLIYLLGYRLSSKMTGLIAALLLTLSPLVINHAQEVRMYVMSMCLGLGGSLALTELLKKFTVSSLAGWLSLRFLAILTTPINILLFLPDVVLLGIELRIYKQQIFKLAKKWLWLLISIAVLLLIALIDIVPPLLDFLGTTDEQQLVPTPGITAFVGALTKFTVWPLTSPFAGLESLHEQFLNFYAVILLCLLGLALFNAKKSRSPKLWYAVAWSFVPLIVLFVFCQIYTRVWGIPRYLLFAAPYIMILLAAGWLKLWRWRKSMAIAVVVVYAIASGGALFNYYAVEYREDWRVVAQTINLNEQQTDVIALFPNNYLPALRYYYQGNYPIHTLKRLPKKKFFSQLISCLSNKCFKSYPQLNHVFGWFLLGRIRVSTTKIRLCRVLLMNSLMCKHIRVSLA